MRTLNVDIRVGRLRYKRVIDIDIARNWHNLTATATISLPRRTFIDGREVKVKDLIKVDDPVTIKIGYNGELTTEFEGYMVRYNPNYPFVIECEDEMRKYKKGNFNVLLKAGTTLKQLITTVYKGDVVYIDPNIKLGHFELIDATPAQVFEELKKTYSIYCFFRGKTLIVGWPYDPTIQQTYVYNPDKNIVDKSSLVYRTKEESKYKITGISLFSDGNRLTYSKGDNGGDQQTRHFYAIPQAELKKNVDREYDLAVYEGWRGNFTTWLYPQINVGDIAKLKNYYYPEFEGKYLIDGIGIKVSKNGARRTIYPGPSAGSVINQ